MDTAAASTTAGEIDFGEMEMFDGPGAAAGKESKILWPGVLLFAVLWFVLAQFRDSDAGIIRVLSWITFSEGGFDRPVPGMIGGALGKGIVAAALVSLCSGGLKNVFRGVRVLFAGSGRRRDIPMILAGIVTGAAAYYVFAGMQASAGTAMAGIAGALLSLETLGSGRLFELAQSLTSRRVNGGRKAMGDRCDGLFTGLTLGFILAAAVSAAGIPGRLL